MGKGSGRGGMPAKKATAKKQTNTSADVNISDESHLSHSNSVESHPPPPSSTIDIGPLNVRIETLNVALSEWTLEEDMFLIRHFDIRKTAPKKLEGMYEGLARRQPDAYTKRSPSLDDLKQRHDTLSADELKDRYTLLNKLVASACAAEDAQMQYEREQALKKQREEEEAAEASKKKGGKAKAPEQDDTNQEEEIEVKVITRRRESTVLASKRVLKQHSAVLRKEIAGLPPPKYVDAPQTLVLNSAAIQYESCRQWEVVEIGVVERLIKMMKAKDCVEKRFELEEKIQALDDAIVHAQDAALADLETRRAGWAEMVRDKASTDADAVRAANESEYQNYVRLIRQAFDARLNTALGECKRASVRLEDDIELFFAGQEERVRASVQTFRDHEMNGLRLQLQEAQAQTEEIFPTNMVLKLGILGQLLEIECVIDAAKTIVKKAPNDFVHCREWECELIKDRYMREILPTMGVRDVIRLQSLGPPVSYLSREHIDREVSSRRKVLWQELSTMSNVALQEFLDQKDIPWPDLAEKAVTDRAVRKAQGTLNVHLVSLSTASFSNSNTTVAIRHYQRHVTVHGLIEKASDTWGRHYFEVFIDNLPADGSTCCLGFDLRRSALDKSPIAGLASGPEGGFGASIQSDGFLNYQGKAEYLGTRFAQGAIVGCGIDLVLNCASFFLGGEKIVKSSIAALKDGRVPIETPYTVVPAATMFGARLGSDVQLTFNFTGPFEHQLDLRAEGWEAFADNSKHR